MHIVHNKIRDTVCLLCFEELDSEEILLDHMLCHGGDLRHKCQFCAKSYTTPSRLKNHIYSFHVIESQGLKKLCSKCGQDVTLSIFEKHMEIHDQPGKFGCAICNWVYT